MATDPCGTKVLPETLYTGDVWRQLEVGVGDRDAWLSGAHAELEAAAGKALPPLHQQWRERQHLIVQNIELIRRLRGRYRMSVLSNADLSLAQRLRDAHISDLFDDVIVSAEVGVAKPEPRIYALAAERLGLSAPECVFIDDAERNVEAARATGMQVVYFLVDRGDDLEDQLRMLGVEAPPAA